MRSDGINGVSRARQSLWWSAAGLKHHAKLQACEDFQHSVESERLIEGARRGSCLASYEQLRAVLNVTLS